MPVIISKEADADIEDIIDYTLENFGINQAYNYYEGLKIKLDSLLDSMVHYVDCSELIEGMKRTQYKKHFVYYQEIGDNEILIVRIMRQGRDEARHFQ